MPQFQLIFYSGCQPIQPFSLLIGRIWLNSVTKLLFSLSEFADCDWQSLLVAHTSQWAPCSPECDHHLFWTNLCISQYEPSFLRSRFSYLKFVRSGADAFPLTTGASSCRSPFLAYHCGAAGPWLFQFKQLISRVCLSSRSILIAFILPFGSLIRLSC